MKKLNVRGFTLIELMITVAVVGILAAVAYPSYTSYILRSKRSAAASFVMTVANKQEAAMTNKRQYFGVADGTDTQWTAVGITVPNEVKSYYTVTAVADNAAAPPTYTITATPKGSQTADTGCGNLTLNQLGTKGVSGTSSVSDCWNR